MKTLDIFTYLDYRKYLADYYSLCKSQDTAFSHRSFLKKAGIPGTVYLQRIMTGKRKLSPKYIDNFVSALGLAKREARYFRTLAHYGNSRLISEKEPLLKELMEIRAQDNELCLQNNQLKFFGKWYYPVVLELLHFVDCRKDFSTLANMVNPRISAAQAAGAVKYLQKNGFLKRNEHGVYVPADAIVTTGPEARSTVLANFHRQNLAWCSDSLSIVESDDRDISSLTLGINHATYRQIKTEVQDFRKRLLALAAKDHDPDMVAHIGFQLMPRSKIKKKDEENAQ
jgi:uncharacterized protein (TIGR02147 family)